jgi:colanic acid biosynthesis glycosyl transferase WcaI
VKSNAFHTSSRRSKRLIFINRYFYPDHSATSQILGDLAFALAGGGTDVAVITSRQRYDDAKAQLPAREEAGGVDIHRVWSAQFGRDNLALRVLDYATFYFAAAWTLLRLCRSGDIVIAKTDPPLISVIAAAVAFVRRARLVNWLQDIFPETAAVLGVGGRPARLIFWPLRMLRNLSLRGATSNVTIGERMADWVRGKGVASSRITIIHNWAASALIRPVPATENPLRREWGLDGRFVVGYSGNLGRAHELDTILDAMSELARQETANGLQPLFLFIGGGAKHSVLRREVEKRGLTNFQTRPYQPASLLAESLSVADVHLISLRPELEGLIVPSKLYGVLAAGRPAVFIGDQDGEVARALHAARCGFSVSAGDGRLLARHIATLASDPAACAAIGERARAEFSARYDKDIAVRKWAALIDTVGNN